jgi:hypothetical protein
MRKQRTNQRHQLILVFKISTGLTNAKKRDRDKETKELMKMKSQIEPN